MSDSGESSSSSSPPDKENDSNSPPSPDSSSGSSSPLKGGGSSDSKSLPPSGSSFKSSPPSPDSLPSNSSSSNSTPPSSSPPPSKESPPPKSDSPPPSPLPSSSDAKNSTTSSSSPPLPSKSSETNPPSSEIEAPPTSKTPPSSSPPPSGSTISTPPVTGGSKQTPTPPVSKSPPATPLSPPRTPSGSGSGSDQVNKSPDDFSPPTDANYTPSIRPPSNSNSNSADSSSNSNSPPSSSDSSSSSSNRNTGTVIGMAIAGVFVIAFIAIFFVIKRRKKRPDTYNNNNYMPPEGYYSTGHSGNSGGPHSTISSGIGSLKGGMYHTGGGSESGVIGGPNPHFSYEELMEITNGFSRQNILGEGGFGCVFKGWLLDGKEVAVKQLKAGSGQGEREFRAEVDIISRVHHRHLVSLVGYCLAENHRLLIYEFVPNKTLEYHLHDNEASVLDWPNRLKIALGAAKGLAYLHEDCHPKIIHRDIKTANILLDEFYEAKVADFGLAKLANDTNTHVSTRVMGTFGYMAPEYASSGKLTDRSDVYSFGVVLLELVTGRKPVDPTQPLGEESLVEWARPLLMRALQTGDLSEIIDPRLEKHYAESEMFRMIEAAAACIRHSAPKRPRMMQVVRALDCEGEHSDLSNGLKYGQSTIYDSGQYNQDISKFRKMALGSEDSSEYEIYSGDYNSKEYSGPHKNPLNNTWSGESETRAFKQG